MFFGKIVNEENYDEFKKNMRNYEAIQVISAKSAEEIRKIHELNLKHTHENLKKMITDFRQLRTDLSNLLFNDINYEKIMKIEKTTDEEAINETTINEKHKELMSLIKEYYVLLENFKKTHHSLFSTIPAAASGAGGPSIGGGRKKSRKTSQKSKGGRKQTKRQTKKQTKRHTKNQKSKGGKKQTKKQTKTKSKSKTKSKK